MLHRSLDNAPPTRPVAIPTDIHLRCKVAALYEGKSLKDFISDVLNYYLTNHVDINTIIGGRTATQPSARGDYSGLQNENKADENIETQQPEEAGRTTASPAPFTVSRSEEVEAEEAPVPEEPSEEEPPAAAELRPLTEEERKEQQADFDAVFPPLKS